MSEAQSKTAAEVLPDLGSGEEETEENLPLFPTPSSGPSQEFPEREEPFDWYNDPSIILHDQAAIAAYYNPADELVIKQRDTLGCPEMTIFVAPENVSKFLAGVRDRAKRGDA